MGNMELEKHLCKNNACSQRGVMWQNDAIFFEETVNSEHYLSMLCNTFGPHLLATGLLLQTQWFMHDGARPHTADVVSDFLRDIFNLGVISSQLPDGFACGQNWPPEVLI
jgi:hypothetical protein